MMVKIDGRREEERGTHTANADACSYSSRLVRLTVISVYQLATTFLQKNEKKNESSVFVSDKKRKEKRREEKKKLKSYPSIISHSVNYKLIYIYIISFY